MPLVQIKFVKHHGTVFITVNNNNNNNGRIVRAQLSCLPIVLNLYTYTRISVHNYISIRTCIAVGTEARRRYRNVKNEKSRHTQEKMCVKSMEKTRIYVNPTNTTSVKILKYETFLNIKNVFWIFVVDNTRHWLFIWMTFQQYNQNRSKSQDRILKLTDYCFDN